MKHPKSFLLFAVAMLIVSLSGCKKGDTFDPGKATFDLAALCTQKWIITPTDSAYVALGTIDFNEDGKAFFSQNAISEDQLHYTVDGNRINLYLSQDEELNAEELVAALEVENLSQDRLQIKVTQEPDNSLLADPLKASLNVSKSLNLLSEKNYFKERDKEMSRLKKEIAEEIISGW